jgi:anti-sigma-K factor RskA
MTGAETRHDDIEVLAGEYVLGLLDAADAAALEARAASEPAVRAAIASARERFLALDVAAPAARVEEALWRRIEAGLGGTEASKVVSLDAHRKASARPAARTARGGFWQGFAAASVVALIAGALAYGLVRPADPRLIVVLLDAEAKPVSLVEAFAGQRIRVVPLKHIDVPAGKTLQVWTLPDPKTGPVSMGLLPAVSKTVLEGPELPAPKLDQLYEITIEPAGGSPTGRPTGPVVGKGFARIPQI